MKRQGLVSFGPSVFPSLNFFKILPKGENARQGGSTLPLPREVFQRSSYLLQYFLCLPPSFWDFGQAHTNTQCVFRAARSKTQTPWLAVWDLATLTTRHTG